MLKNESHLSHTSSVDEKHKYEGFISHPTILLTTTKLCIHQSKLILKSTKAKSQGLKGCNVVWVTRKG